MFQCIPSFLHTRLAIQNLDTLPQNANVQAFAAGLEDATEKAVASVAAAQ